MSMQDSGDSMHPPVIPGPLAQPESSERPTWATTCGVLMIVLAVSGLLSAATTAMMPKMMRMQQEGMEAMQASMQQMAAQQAQQQQQQQQDGQSIVRPITPPPMPQDPFKMMSKMLDQPPWFETWCYLSAALVVLVNIGIVAGAVMLLMLRPAGITLSIAVISVAILLGLARVGAGITLSSMMAFNLICMSGLGLIFSIAILIVLLVSNKESYHHVRAMRDMAV